MTQRAFDELVAIADTPLSQLVQGSDREVPQVVNDIKSILPALLNPTDQQAVQTGGVGDY